MWFSAVTFVFAVAAVGATVFDFGSLGGVADDDSLSTAQANAQLLNKSLASLVAGDALVIPNQTFHLMGGVLVSGLDSVTVTLDGTLKFKDDIKHWPNAADGRVADCVRLRNIKNVTITSNGKGTMDGSGKAWWGLVGYLVHKENRPKLLVLDDSTDVRLSNLLLLDSPYYTLAAHQMNGLEIGHVDVSARRTKKDSHDLYDLTAFNTDGLDVTGKNVWIHDCNIWNQDDCIAVKDGSEDMLIERINASGVGLTIGSISGSVVRNITFRDSYMHNTYKGIYVKVREGNDPASISDVLYENIVIESPEQSPIWLGPAQQADNRDPCHAHPCSLCWPNVPFAECNAPAAATWTNITLRNITILNPKHSPGLIMANVTNPMKNVVFDSVKVVNPGQKPWGDKYYHCEGVQGVATGDTWPVPPCFEDRTNRAEKLRHSAGKTGQQQKDEAAILLTEK